MLLVLVVLSCSIYRINNISLLTFVCMCVCTGHSGTGGRYSQYAPGNTTGHPAAFTGGLTEEEQLDAAIRNSLNDRGKSRGGV